MTYKTEEERIAARRLSKRGGKPKTHFYPDRRAPRVDRSSMSDEEWVAHKRQKQNERSARYNARNPGLTNGKLRQRRADNPWWSPVLAAKDRAKQRGLAFDLTQEWAAARYTGICELTGFPFVVSAQSDAGKSGGRAYSPSIDRITPDLGYVQGNCRFVLFSINSFKGTMTDIEMLTIAKALVERST